MRARLPRRFPTLILGLVLAVVAAMLAAGTVPDHQQAQAASSPLHFAANEGTSYAAPAAVGYNLHDTNMNAAVINALPAGSQALVWTGTPKCPLTLDPTFTSFVDANATNARIFGYYLVDEPSDTTAACVGGIAAMADYIHTHSTFQKAVVLLTDYPGTYAAYSPASAHVDLVALDPYPCRYDIATRCDFTMIDAAVSAARAAGIPQAAIVPVFQEFGDPSIWLAPTAAELQSLLAEWAKVVPSPVFDFTYTWNTQPAWNQTDALATRPDWQQVMRSYFNGTRTNVAPVVDAGADQTVTLPASASLDATVYDDGLPNPPATLTTTWSKVSGPGTVTFANASAVDTTATFSAAGTYVLRLAASDSLLTGTDTVTVTVQPAAGPRALDVRVSAGSDDAEQRVGGSTIVNSTDLQLVMDGRKQQVVGIRFRALQIPRGATITSAWLQFQADEADTGATALTVKAENSGNPPTYSSTSAITSRAVTGSVAWAPPGWPTVGAAGAPQRTPDLSTLVQAVVGRSDWSPGNALALQISGSGRRTAESYEGSRTGAPLLHVEYTAP